MIRQLRIKIIVIIMGIITLLLITIFSSLYLSSRHDFRYRSNETIKTALKEMYPPGSLSPKKHNGTPILVVEIDPDHQIRVLRNRLSDADDEHISLLFDMIEPIAGDSGEIAALNLRYASAARGRDGEHETIRYAFADITLEKNSLHSQLVNSLLIGLLSFCVLLFITFLLSGWLVKPVMAAWAKQKAFIADASHELKTPLTVILSNTSILLDSNRSGETIEKDRERLNNIEDEGTRMKQLIEKMLLLARADAGREAGHHTMLNFSYLVQSVTLRFEPVAYDMGKALEYDIADNLQIKGNEKDLENVLEILLDNACKYSSPQGIIRLKLVSCCAKELLFSIESTGAPISKDELRLIFHRFYRADTSRSTISGYGLGLSIAQSVIAEHGGRIWAESDGCMSNTFYVKLPIES